jgi:hypothetical protein
MHETMITDLLLTLPMLSILFFRFVTFAGCTAVSRASAAGWTFGSYHRGVGIFL